MTIKEEAKPFSEVVALDYLTKFRERLRWFAGSSSIYLAGAEMSGWAKQFASGLRVVLEENRELRAEIARLHQLCDQRGKPVKARAE